MVSHLLLRPGGILLPFRASVVSGTNPGARACLGVIVCYHGCMTENSERTPLRVVPTNQEVADRIGLSHSGVSRIRSGQRLPGIDTMSAIERVYNWSVQSQVAARGNKTYAAEFEIAIAGTPGGELEA